jgi:creatinine amidohydrolase/Fe(II)-dependent formamide hydrolase-like protein
MAGDAPRRVLGGLTHSEASQAIKNTSILCLPLGAIEQHGPHLPLDTDVIVAEGLTRRLLERWGEEYDLWQLPTLPIGLSREHDWAAGTLSLSITGFTACLRDLAATLVRSLPARNLAIINGHGGNRGLLETLLHELRGDFGLNACVLHPFDLAGANPVDADVHGGKGETSVMLVIAPERVRRDRVGGGGPPDPKAVQALIFDRGASFAWRTDDPRLARDGIVGDAFAASADFGAALVERMVTKAGDVFARLQENQRFMPAAKPPR